MKKIYWHSGVDLPHKVDLPSWLSHVKMEIDARNFESSLSDTLGFRYYTIWSEYDWSKDLSDGKMEIQPCREKPDVYLEWDDYIPNYNDWSIDFDVWNSFWNMDDKDDFIKNVENFLNKDRNSDNWIHIDSFNMALVWAQQLSAVNLVEMYNKWDNFEVVKPTYLSNFFATPNLIFQDWYVNVRSQKTWKVYRAISFLPKGSKRPIEHWDRIKAKLNLDKKIPTYNKKRKK